MSSARPTVPRGGPDHDPGTVRRCPRAAQLTRRVAVLAAGLTVLALALVPAGPAGLRAVDHLGNLASLVAVVACLAAARGTSGRTALTWSCFAATALTWLLADLLWSVDQQWVAGAGLGDAARVLYLLGALPCVVGVLVVPVGRWERGARVRLALDALVLATAGVLVADALVLRDLLPSSPGGGDVVAVLYPVTDLVVVSLALTLGRRRHGPPRADLLLLAAAFLVWTVTDLAFARVTVARADYFVTPVGVGYVVAPLLLALAALCALRDRDTDATGGAMARHAASRVLAPLPEIVVLVAGLVALVRQPETWHEWTLVGLGAGLAVVRQVLLAVDGHELRSTLEERVAARTGELQELADRHQQILGSVVEGIFGVDGAGRITFVNAAAERLLGWRSTVLLGRPACERVCAEDHDDCLLDAVLGQGRALPRTETVYRRADGALLPVEITATPLVGDGGQGAVVCFRDVAERALVEEMKRHFISAVSHELRTPLSAIRGSLEMLADGDAGALPPPALELVSMGERGAQRLGRLVDDIIDVERLSTGEFDVVARPEPLEPLLRSTVATMRPLAEQHGVRIEVGEVAGDALCDADRVVQALVNLVGNAVKFTPPGAAVHVSAETRGAEVMVTVRDEGRGIPEEDLDRVFDRFHQVHVPESRDLGGTGLGLTITKSIVQRHGGKIWLTSVLGAGSTFRFTLPAAAPPASDRDAARRLAQAGSVSAPA
ncbi:PAS domain S-box-containing protein [Nocardioides scoriae]|uniref:Sensor-like histidine kinase SenX3 n=1 Tax=Nocardioides scoriae TaxID=642780 RepID=A0A1H1WQV1_9ACTN|nr:PAS domain S-box-containing protein [Nocardioides scoriae]